MTPTRYQEIRDLFLAARGLGSSSRGQFLAQACADDSELRAEVEALIREERSDASFLQTPVMGVGFTLPDPAAATRSAGPRWGSRSEAAVSFAARQIGRYQILGLLGEGGMGVVYKALQDSPPRVVALKLIRPGFATPARLRQLRYEARVLGRLQHPGIAQIFEAAAAEADGSLQPYFAMEYVQGAPLLSYASDAGLDVRQRLELLARICDAVQHAHQNSVIHRDLKPANVLVVTQSSQPAIPKILDFGVAKLIDPDLHATTWRSDAAGLMGTIAYMSPEQVGSDPGAVDTRSDVYALGVMLYELLCGRLPYELRGKSLPQAAEVIRGTPPQNPSRVNRALGGDIATIVLKALAKNRDHRYPTAAALAQDIRRYLGREPIEARRPTAAYHLRMLIARHRGLFVSLAALVVGLVAFAAAMTMLYSQAESQRARAQRAEQTALRETDAATRVSTNLTNLLKRFDPYTTLDGRNGGLMLAPWDLLERSAQTIQTDLADHPLMQASLLETLAEVYRSLELHGRSIELTEKVLSLRRSVLDANDPVVLFAHRTLWLELTVKGELGRAEQTLRDALNAGRATYGESHPWYINAITDLAAIARLRGDLEQATDASQWAMEQRRQQSVTDPPALVQSLHAVARCSELRGDFQDAEQRYREALAICRGHRGDADTSTLGAIKGLSRLLSIQGRTDEAEAECRGLLASIIGARGEADPLVTDTLAVLTEVLELAGRYDDAAVMCRQTLERRRGRLGNDHASTGSTIYNLIRIDLMRNDVAELLSLYDAAFAVRNRDLAFPEDHPHRAGSALHLGTLSLGLGDLHAAEQFLRECVDLRRRALSPEHWLTAAAESDLADCLTRMGRVAEAEPLLLRSYAVLRCGIGPADPRTVQALQRIVTLLEARGDARVQEYRAQLPPQRRAL